MKRKPLTWWSAAEVRRKERKAAQERIDRTQIAIAKAKGFRDCNEVFDLLGIPEINAGGIRRSKFQVATQYILEAGVKLSVIIEDGYSDVPPRENAMAAGALTCHRLSTTSTPRMPSGTGRMEKLPMTRRWKKGLHGAKNRPPWIGTCT